MSAAFGFSDVLSLLLHCATMSLLTVGGGMIVIPDFHRFLVGEHAWVNDTQFAAAIALGQSAPGPNILFVAALGWSAGFNGGGYPWALAFAVISMLGILLPSSVLALAITRWAHNNKELRLLRAFKQGLAPVVVALLLATAWLLGAAHNDPATDWKLWLLAVVTGVLVLKTRLHLLWILATAAGLGMMGWV